MPSVCTSSVSSTLTPAKSLTLAFAIYVVESSNTATSSTGTITVKIPLFTSAVYVFLLKIIVTVCPSSISVVFPDIPNDSALSCRVNISSLISLRIIVGAGGVVRIEVSVLTSFISASPTTFILSLLNCLDDLKFATIFVSVLFLVLKFASCK